MARKKREIRDPLDNTPPESPQETPESPTPEAPADTPVKPKVARPAPAWTQRARTLIEDFPVLSDCAAGSVETVAALVETYGFDPTHGFVEVTSTDDLRAVMLWTARGLSRLLKMCPEVYHVDIGLVRQGDSWAYDRGAGTFRHAPADAPPAPVEASYCKLIYKDGSFQVAVVSAQEYPLMIVPGPLKVLGGFELAKRFAVLRLAEESGADLAPLRYGLQQEIALIEGRPIRLPKPKTP